MVRPESGARWRTECGVPRLAPASRLTRVAAVAMVALVVLLAACSDSEQSLPKPKPGFCEAAQRYDHRVERKASIDEQITILEKLARNAPEDVAADAHLFLDSMRKLQAGDRSVVGNKKVEAAVEHVDRRAINGCGFYDPQADAGGI